MDASGGLKPQGDVPAGGPGLTTAEAARRLAQHGRNEVSEKKANPVILFLRKFWGVTPWMLELTAVLTFALHREIEAFVVLGLLVFNAVLGFTQESRANAALEQLKRRLQVNARVRRDGSWAVIPAWGLVPGDLVRLRAGDFVPADLRLVHGSIEVDQSALTGESLSQEKKENDTVYSGSLVRRWEATGTVTATGARTYYGRTAELVRMAKPKLHMEDVTARVVRWLLAMVGALVLAGLAFTVVRGGSVVDFVTLAVVLLVSAIPVALPTMFTVSMALGSVSLAAKGVLITRLSAGEDAASMDVLCADKTGTITMNKLSVAEVVPLGLTSKEGVIRYGCLASQEADQDPIDLALFAAAKEMGVSLAGFGQTGFSPFDASTRMTRATVTSEGRSFFIWKGSVGAVGAMTKGGGEMNARAAAELNRLWSKGYKVIAVAAGEKADSAQLIGIIALVDLPRPDSRRLIAELDDMGICVKMLTGDAVPIASETAAAVGIEGRIAKSSELKGGDVAGIAEGSGGFAEVYPEDKYLIVKGLQERGHVVGMTGDGVNDAPALKQSEVGIAVSNATDVAKSSASVVLTKEGLGGTVDLVNTGRMIYQRIVTWILNKVVKTFQIVVFVVLAFLITGQFVVSVLSMVLFLLVTDFVTLSLSTDAVKPSRKPDTWNVRWLVQVAAVLGILTVAESFMLLYLGFALFGLQGDVAHLQTFVFDYLVFMGVLNVLILRERGHFWESMPSRTLLLFIVADIVVVSLISLAGIPQLPAIGPGEILAVLAFSAATCFLVNDFAKVALVRRFASGEAWRGHSASGNPV